MARPLRGGPREGGGEPPQYKGPLAYILRGVVPPDERFSEGGGGDTRLWWQRSGGKGCGGCKREGRVAGEKRLEHCMKCDERVEGKEGSGKCKGKSGARCIFIGELSKIDPKLAGSIVGKCRRSEEPTSDLQSQ